MNNLKKMRKLINYILGDKAFLLITPFGFNKGNWATLRKNAFSQFTGKYEINLIPKIEIIYKNTIQNKEPIIFDIGASYGYYSSYFCRSKQVRVIAFEPDQKASVLLNKLSIRNKNLLLVKKKISSIQDNNDDISFLSAVKKYGNPNLIKIDIEGYEEELLLNNLDYFKKYKTVIIVEVHSLKIENVLKLSFENIGYNIEVIDNDHKTLKIRNVQHNRWLILSKKS
tara:strand:+ start:103 stop:780 length:678 start_codon:yes stop_codon:yes gene_type:complete